MYKKDLLREKFLVLFPNKRERERERVHERNRRVRRNSRREIIRRNYTTFNPCLRDCVVASCSRVRGRGSETPASSRCSWKNDLNAIRALKRLARSYLGVAPFRGHRSGTAAAAAPAGDGKETRVYVRTYVKGDETRKSTEKVEQEELGISG